MLFGLLCLILLIELLLLLALQLFASLGGVIFEG